MKKQADFLVEILSEELPPKALQRLGLAFQTEIESRLKKMSLAFKGTQYFASPRRLAVLVNQLASEQADTAAERKGPALNAAFNEKGEPTPACIGFARSCGVTPKELEVTETPQGKWVSYKQIVKGKKIVELLPELIQQSLAALPIPKRMRWGNSPVEFIRPVHGVILLFDNEVISAEILGCKTGRKTLGHRFMSQGWIEIKAPADYAEILENQGHVIADFEKRKNLIRKQIEEKSKGAVISDALLDEVTGLVEWPIALSGQFDSQFLSVPPEVLISAMQDHQRYFPVMDEHKKLLPQFVTVSNIESKNPPQVIAGNERVLRARLADAAFFFEKDQLTPLEKRVEKLKHIVFQAKLGSLYDKAERLAKLAGFIANELSVNVSHAERAGRLAKADLTTGLVGEFPELQGIAGYYYALHDGESKEIALALNEHYMPRISGGELPSSLLGCTIALADKIDTLIGVFGIRQAPTGDKDPLGLRRAALGVLRILIEKKLNCDLLKILSFAVKNYQVKLENSQADQDVFNFMLDRMRPWYQEQGILPDVFASVAALNISRPYDFHCRVQAVQLFKKMSEAESLSIANKRVSNILAKYPAIIAAADIDEKLFEYDAERVLAAKLKEQQNSVISLSSSAQYQQVLEELAHLRQSVDEFFDKVLVMTDDKKRRENRILLLKKLRELFLHVADIALLQ